MTTEEIRKEFKVQHYNVKEFPYTPEELAEWDKEFMPERAESPIAVMMEACAIKLLLSRKTPGYDLAKAARFLKWYQLRYYEDTPYGRKYTTLNKIWFP